MTERTETAYHEAGHAVALFDLGDATIVASEDNLGRIGTPIDEALADRLDMLEYLGEDGRMFIVRQIDVALSGVKAVEILTGREHDPQSSDVQTWLPGSDYYRLNWLLPMVAEGTEEMSRVLTQEWKETENVLRENWDAVRALAEALLDRGKLDAAAVRSILEETGCARDEAPIRRVVLEVEGDKLRERRLKLMTEGDPANKLEGLQEVIASTDNELELLRREEMES